MMILIRLFCCLGSLNSALSQATFTRQGEDNGLAEIAAIRIPSPEDGSGPAPPTKLRLDIGWSTWKKPKVSERCAHLENQHTFVFLYIIVGWVCCLISSAICQKVEGAEEEGDGAPEGTEVDFALIFYNLAVGRLLWLMT